MELNVEMNQLYERMASKIPEMVRHVVKPQLLEKAIQKCQERNGKEVAEVDLVTAMFEVTPPAFQPTMIEDLKDVGIDVDRYYAKVGSNFKHSTDLEQMVADVEKVCKIADVGCNKDAMWKVIRAYEKFFVGSSVSMRTTTKEKEKRDVAIRYVELMVPHNPDAYQIALENDLIKQDGHPIHDFMREIKDKFEVMGYGVDLDARKGLAKIWPFLVPGPIEPVYDMKFIPPAVKNYQEYFKKHGLDIFSLFALDFRSKTTNIYFMIKDHLSATPEKYSKLLEDAGFTPGSKKIMESCCKALTIYYTYSWESEKIERVCFGMVCPDERDVPVELHPLMKKFLDEAPIISSNRHFIYSIAFTPKGEYYKVETDYNGTMVDLLKMGSQAGLDTAKIV